MGAVRDNFLHKWCAHLCFVTRHRRRLSPIPLQNLSLRADASMSHQ
jgi:hypothetical protein